MQRSWGEPFLVFSLAGLSLFVEINVSGSLSAEASKHRIPLINPSCSFSHTYQVSFQAGFHSLVGLPSWIHTVHNDLNIPGFLTFTFLWHFIKFVSSRAFALKRPNSINAISSLTEPRDGLAFVHICQILEVSETERKKFISNSLQKTFTSWI